MKTEARPNPGHESTDASPRLVRIMAAALALGIGAVLIASYGVFSAGRAHRALAPALGPAAAFQYGPEEQNATEQAWKEIDAETRQNLDTYGWVDRRAGVVRIPIDRAMAVMAGQKP